MSYSQPKALALVLVSIVPLTMTLGCRFESKKNDSGNGDNVKIATPFGGMSVRTDSSAVAQSTGLQTYPGATPYKKKDKNDHNDSAADVNMSFGGFQLRVKAVSYITPDSPDQVVTFYKKALARFGTVIQCRDHEPIGTPSRTADGLSCSDDEEKDSHVHVSNGVTGKTELKAGSKQHQHIVSVDPDNNGTKFALVAIDLPGHFLFGGKDEDKDKDSDEGKQ